MEQTPIEKSQYNKKIKQLLSIFEQNRNSIMDMITDLEKLKDKLDTIFPETTDARHMRFFEEKVKAISSFFNVLLDMRKEINKSLKDEMEMRRKSEGKEADFDIESLLDIRQATRNVEKFQRTADRIKEKRMSNIKNLELPEGVGVPGINAKAEGL